MASLLPDHPVVEVRYFGQVTAADRTEAFTDLNDLVDALSALGMTERFREAVVRPTDVTAAVSVGFWETAGVNRRPAIRTFRTRSEALDWLEGEPVAGGDRLVPATE